MTSTHLIAATACVSGSYFRLTTFDDRGSEESIGEMPVKFEDTERVDTEAQHTAFPKGRW